MNKTPMAWPLAVASLFALVLLATCGKTSSPAVDPLSAANINLIFVASEDLAYQSPGDVNSQTANLTDRGLQRALRMGSFLKQQVLGNNNVNSIFALAPMTHLQTSANYPDMAGLETIQQFAMLNQVSISSVAANSYPILASYSQSLPANVAAPVPPCAACQGIDFADQDGDNEALVNAILQANVPGFYVFSAPWETVSALMARTNQREGYNLALPPSYAGPDFVYVISIAPSGTASLINYNGNLNPAPGYPSLPPVIGNASCMPAPFHIQVTGGSGGAIIPAGTNTNETVYMIRHAEAHPALNWDDGNYVGAGQWRALDLPNALAGKIHPNQVYSIDPAVGIPGGDGSIVSSYVRPSLTAEPYAIANNLPLNLAASVAVFAQNAPQLSTMASDFFFTAGTFSNQTLLVAWEHDHIPPTVNALLASYQSTQTAPNWSDTDYDTIWTVTLDAQGNLTVDNAKCEGIRSASLPPAPPPF